MLRPTMVSIVNVMHELLNSGNRHAVTVERFQQSLQDCVELGVHAIEKKLSQESLSLSSRRRKKKKFTIATFSRSGTLRQVLTRFLEHKDIEIVCGRSSPGNEGEWMARDLQNAAAVTAAAAAPITCISDLELKTWLATSGTVDLLLIGCDCILPKAKKIVNKVGTRDLCEIARQHKVPVYCCTDRWKIWKDIFPRSLLHSIYLAFCFSASNQFGSKCTWNSNRWPISKYQDSWS